MLTETDKQRAREFLEDHLKKSSFVIIVSDKAHSLVGNPSRAVMLGTLEISKAIFLRDVLLEPDPDPSGDGGKRP